MKAVTAAHHEIAVRDAGYPRAMWRVKAFGYTLISIGVTGLVMIPWLRANGRADETGEAVTVVLVCFAIGGLILFIRRRDRI